MVVVFNVFNLFLSLSKQRLHLIPAFKQYAAASMILHEDILALQASEQVGFQRLPHRGIPYINVRIRREWARLGTAMGIYVKKSASGRKAAAGALLITGEGYK